MVFDGYVNAKVFEFYCETQLLPQLEPGSVMVMDNASFHKGLKIKELFEKAGVILKFLPPYCPHLNKIEKNWNGLKMKIRQKLESFSGDLFKCAEFAFLQTN
jgi:transposase